MNLTYQYFGLFTALAIVRTLISFKFDLAGVCKIIETGCTTVTYAPMLCVLFLGSRMRAIQLAQGETDKFELPQSWVQQSMYVCTVAVLLQVVLVLLVGIISGTGSVTTDAEGNLDVSKMPNQNQVAIMVMTAVRYSIMAMLYGGTIAVIAGIFQMQGPKEIWGDSAPPVSPAVLCTILLTTMFFIIYLIVAIANSLFEVVPSMRSSQMLLKLEASAKTAKMTVNFAPMLAILFIGARMRALQIDPKNGSPQPWAQKCFFMCTLSVLFQAICAVVLPFVADAQCKRGDCEGDVSFEMGNKTVGMVMTAIRYACLFALYVGVAAVVYSVFTIEAADPTQTPPVSPAMKCTMMLAAQYFLIYTFLFVAITAKSFVLGPHIGADSVITRTCTNAIGIADAARATVMFAPMLSVLCIGTRMRSMQLALDTNKHVPPTAGPQLWAQQAMFASTYAVFIQLVMSILVPILTGTEKPELDADGNVKMPSGGSTYLAMLVELIRYASLIALYVGATTVCVGVVMMSPTTIQPYQVKGIPGLGL
jgi:hypothetical protein